MLVLQCPFLDDIVFLEPARCVQAWMLKALELYKKSCPPGNQNLRIMQENWDEMRQQELLHFVDGSSLARRFVSTEPCDIAERMLKIDHDTAYRCLCCSARHSDQRTSA